MYTCPFGAKAACLFIASFAVSAAFGANYEWTVALGEPQIAFSSSTFTSVLDGVAADVNADGRPDLVFLGGTPDRAPFVSLNVSTAGTFVAGTPQQLGDTGRYLRLQVADMTGDGRPDVIAGGLDGPVRIFVNDGGPQPFGAGTVQTVGDGKLVTNAFAVGDVNGDGFADIATTHGGADKAPGNDLYLSNGTSTPFAGVVRQPIGADDVYGYQIKFADIDGDGRQDAFVSSVDVVNGFSGQAAGIRYYINNGGANPYGGVTPGFIATGVIDSGIATADLNADQRQDLIVTSSSQGMAVWSIYLHSASSTQPYGAKTVLPHTNFVSSICPNIIATDLNGDSRIDVAIGCSGGGGYPFSPISIFGALYMSAGGAQPFANAEAIEIVVPSDDAHSTINALRTMPVNGRTALLVTSGDALAQPMIKIYPLIDNRRPIAYDDVAEILRGMSANINVIANDIDADGTIARNSVEIRQQGASGTCAVDKDTSTLRYVPANPDFVGTDRCQYVAKDNLGTYSNAATVSVTVTPPSPVGGAASGRGSGGGGYDFVSLLFLIALRAVRTRKT